MNPPWKNSGLLFGEALRAQAVDAKSVLNKTFCDCAWPILSGSVTLTT